MVSNKQFIIRVHLLLLAVQWWCINIHDFYLRWKYEFNSWSWWDSKVLRSNYAKEKQETQIEVSCSLLTCLVWYLKFFTRLLSILDTCALIKCNVWQLKKKEILYELWGRIIAAESDCKMQITRHSLFLYFYISQQWLIPADSCLLTCLLMSWWCSKVNKDHVSLIIRVSEETTRYLKLIQFRRNIVYLLSLGIILIDNLMVTQTWNGMTKIKIFLKETKDHKIIKYLQGMRTAS